MKGKWLVQLYFKTQNLHTGQLFNSHNINVDFE